MACEGSSFGMNDLDYRSVSNPNRDQEIDEEHVYCVDNLDELRRQCSTSNSLPETRDEKRTSSKPFVVVIFSAIAVMSIVISIVAIVIVFQRSSGTSDDNTIPTAQLAQIADITPERTIAANVSIKQENENPMVDIGLFESIRNLTFLVSKLEHVVSAHASRMTDLEARTGEWSNFHDVMERRIFEMNETSNERLLNVRKALRSTHGLTMKVMDFVKETINQSLSKQYATEMEKEMETLKTLISRNDSILRSEIKGVTESTSELEIKIKEMDKSLALTKGLRQDIRITKRKLEAHIVDVFATINNKHEVVRSEMQNETKMFSAKYTDLMAFFGRRYGMLNSEMRNMEFNLSARLDEALARYQNTSEILILMVAQKTKHPVRLVGRGSTSTSGRVEVYNNGKWGTVCDDNWDFSDGKVVCRMLGFSTATRVSGSETFGAGTGEIWLDEVDCQGSESAISDCRSNGWGNHNCQHAEDAAVVCV